MPITYSFDDNICMCVCVCVWPSGRSLQPHAASSPGEDSDHEEQAPQASRRQVGSAWHVCLQLQCAPDFQLLPLYGTQPPPPFPARLHMSVPKTDTEHVFVCMTPDS